MPVFEQRSRAGAEVEFLGRQMPPPGVLIRIGKNEKEPLYLDAGAKGQQLLQSEWTCGCEGFKGFIDDMNALMVLQFIQQF